MEKTLYATRIKRLQKVLKEKNIDLYFLADADYHNSEYVGDHDKLRSAYSGFSGSNGNLLVSRKDAFLWTDGRYFIQAEKELEGSGIGLMRMGEKGVPDIKEFLLQYATENYIAAEKMLSSMPSSKNVIRMGLDKRCISYEVLLNWRTALETAGFSLEIYEDDTLAREILEEEEPCVLPERIVSQIRVLPEELRGENTENRIKKIRDNLLKQKADAFFSGKLDTNMWLLNLRGEDVLYNPVAFSYVMVLEEKTILFAKKQAVNEEVAQYLQNQNIQLCEYDNIVTVLEKEIAGKMIVTDFSSCNSNLAAVFEKKAKELRNGDCEVALLQAIKTKKEIEKIKEVYRKDSVAVCKFLYWLSKQKPGTVTEYEAECKMDALRMDIPENRGLSFHTISAYGANAAMMHYECKEEEKVFLQEGNLYLLDSGGQYEGGTTDVTRTVAIGTASSEMKKHFTMVVRGMLALQNARFLKGCTGMNLDILARLPMWEAELDYKCGTGHGIGYMLNVHEGPQAIRVKNTGVAGKTEFQPGMLISDEPGIYLEGKYGIRMENILLCKEICENSDGCFLGFEPLTFVPIDSKLINKDEMQPKEWEQYVNYQKQVYEVVAPFLSMEERAWLHEATRV